jgi:prepilin-type N-terminal cleavage/methylation domain-containing protein
MKINKSPRKNKGFTLVELAIVLTIIALIVGGIVSGEKLLESYRLASVVSSIGKYKNAFDDFQAQYMAYPGDMDDAGTVFPSQGSVPAAGSGNNNGRIEENSGEEEFKAWQHLGRANLVQGNFSGTGSTTNYRLGTNIPEGPHESGMFRLVYNSLHSLNTHYLIYSRAKISCSDSDICTRSAIINGNDALSIDIKIDDGVYNTGKIRARSDDIYDDLNAAVRCVSGGAYRANVRGRICTLYYAVE